MWKRILEALLVRVLKSWIIWLLTFLITLIGSSAISFSNPLLPSHCTVLLIDVSYVADYREALLNEYLYEWCIYSSLFQMMEKLTWTVLLSALLSLGVYVLYIYLLDNLEQFKQLEARVQIHKEQKKHDEYDDNHHFHVG